MNRTWAATIGLGSLVLCGASCGGAQAHPVLFSTDWEDDGGASIGRVWERIASAPIARAADVVLGVTAQGDAIVAMPLAPEGNALGPPWTYTHALDARPVVAGGLVVGAGGGDVFALDAATGQPVWHEPAPGLSLIGAGDDGALTAVTFQRAGGMGSVLLAVARDGHIVRRVETLKPLGVPAVVNRIAFVPWAGQYVSAVDLMTGDEAARVTLRQETSRAWTEGGSLWFGQVGFIRFDERIRYASQGKASTVMLPTRELPGTPQLMAPGGTPMPVTANADDKVRLFARPSGGSQGASIEDARFYATYFRLAMGFDTAGAKLVWVHLHPTDFLGGAAGSGGIVLCDGRGKVTSLDAKSGDVVFEGDLGRPMQACVVNIDAARLGGALLTGKSLVEQLEQAVTADDPQLTAAQKILLHALSGVTDTSATKTLVDLASDPRTGPDLLADARSALAKRRNGANYMEAALARHYDYLKDVLRAPPVAPLAKALGAMKDKNAAPLLAAHLIDPSDTEEDVKEAAAALDVVAGPAEVPALRQFFGMYRATADDDDVAAALVSVGHALVALRGAEGRAQVQAAIDDAMTVPYARERLADVLSATKPREADGGAQNAPKK